MSQLKGARNKSRRVGYRAVEGTPGACTTEWDTQSGQTRQQGNWQDNQGGNNFYENAPREQPVLAQPVQVQITKVPGSPDQAIRDHMERSERFWAEAHENQRRNDQRFDSIEQAQKRLEKTLGDLVGRFQQRERGKLPVTR